MQVLSEPKFMRCQNHLHKNTDTHTLTRLLWGYLFSTLLLAFMADLFDPWSRASKMGQFLELVYASTTANRRWDESDARVQLRTYGAVRGFG